MSHSACFAPYRTAGVVLNRGGGAVLNTLGTHAFLTLGAGAGFQVYDVEKLTLALISAAAPEPVT